MKTNKVSASPLLSALIVLLTVTLGAMGFVIVMDDRSVTGQLSRLMLAVGGIVLVAVIAMLLLRDARNRLSEQAEQNERNQAAILQLLDELADLAEGDLTVHASVTENFTGAIADSINFAIDQMRGLVSNINRVSVRVARAAEETQTDRAQPRERVGEPGARNHRGVDRNQRNGGVDRSRVVERRRIGRRRRTRGCDRQQRR